MTFTDIALKAPLSKPLKSTDQSTDLIVKGQCTFLFSNKNNTKPCIFYIYNEDKSDGYKVILGVEFVLVIRISDGTQYTDSTNTLGLDKNPGAYYWFSLDTQNQTFRVGVGEARVETIIYKYTFFFTEDANRKTNKKLMESMTSIQIAKESTFLEPIKLLRDPVTNKLANQVIDTDSITMLDIALGTYLPKANLSLQGQQLYHCISGKNFTLDTPDFPDFVEAIEYSIKTPGAWCYERLKAKSTEFNKDKPNPLETYLRITLGQNNGESPGVPYVMEIWPVGHYSPIHNHGAADAIIRVLNGEINVSQFPYLCSSKQGVEPFAVNTFQKNQITWISQTLNQVHQLKNLPENTATCITIQCYMYEQSDTSHYDYFDYIDDDGKEQQYEPDSDMDFAQFRMRMKVEWGNRIIPPPRKPSFLDRLLCRAI
jgi:hypothetical protein